MRYGTISRVSDPERILAVADSFVDDAGQSECGESRHVRQSRVFPHLVRTVMVTPNGHAGWKFGAVVDVNTFGMQSVGNALQSAGSLAITYHALGVDSIQRRKAHVAIEDHDESQGRKADQQEQGDDV